MGDGNLASFIEDVCGEGHLRVETDLGGGFVYAARKRSVDKRRRTSDLLRTSSSKCFEMRAMLTRRTFSYLVLAKGQLGESS